MNQSEEVTLFIDKLDPKYKELFIKLREFIRASIPEAEEKMRWGSPSYVNGKMDICYIAGAGDHVNLGFYRGALIEDKYNLLEGTGKGMRHIKIWKFEDVDKEKVSELLRNAYVFKL